MGPHDEIWNRTKFRVVGNGDAFPGTGAIPFKLELSILERLKAGMCRMGPYGAATGSVPVTRSTKHQH
jgi:hypothetical protein